MNRIVCVVFFALAFSVSVPRSIDAKEGETYQYQVQSENSPEKNRFFFFRFNTETGEVQTLAYDNKSKSSPVSWHSIHDNEKDAYVRIFKK
jgi:hypothetical protein